MKQAKKAKILFTIIFVLLIALSSCRKSTVQEPHKIEPVGMEDRPVVPGLDDNERIKDVLRQPYWPFSPVSTYNNSRYGISFSYPINIGFYNNSGFFRIQLLSPPEDESIKYQDTIMISVILESEGIFPEQMDASEASDFLLAKQKEGLTGFELLQKSETELSGIKAIRTEYHGKPSDPKVPYLGEDIYFTRIVTKKDDRYVWASYSAEKSQYKVDNFEFLYVISTLNIS